MFVKFSAPGEGMNVMGGSDLKRKTILPSKIFANENQAQKLIEGLKIVGRGQGVAWAQSAVGSGPIKFVWKQGNKI